jgi:hypothetical protein
MSHAFDGGIFRVGLKGGFKEWVDGWAEGEGKGGLGALSHGKGGSLYRLLGLDTSALERLLLRLCDALEQSKIQIRAHTNKEGCRSYSRIHTPTHARMRAHTHAHKHTHTRTHKNTTLGRDAWRIDLLGRVGVRATGAQHLPLARRCGAHRRERHGQGHGEGLRQHTASITHAEERRAREVPAERVVVVLLLVVAAAPDSWAAAGGPASAPAGTPQPSSVAARPRSSPCPRARCRRMPRRPRTPAPPPTPVRPTRITSAACSRFALCPGGPSGRRSPYGRAWLFVTWTKQIVDWKCKSSRWGPTPNSWSWWGHTPILGGT